MFFGVTRRLMGVLLIFAAANARALHPMDARFGAPGTNGKANLSSPQLGDIVMDTSDGNFWGWSSTGSWVQMSAAEGMANLTLSNLTSPTAVNQNLIFDTGTSATLQTMDDAAGSTQNLTINSGAPGSGFSSGAVSLFSGSATGPGTSGSVSVSSGSTVNGNSGNISLSVGTPSGTGTAGYILLDGHVVSTGPTPTIGSCGTGPSLVGNDNAGRVNVGSGVSSCSINFAQAWTNAPLCSISNATARVALKVVPTTTGLTISAAANFAASTILTYQCVGYQ